MTRQTMAALIAGTTVALAAGTAGAQTEVQRLGQDPGRKSTATSIGQKETPLPAGESDDAPALFGQDRAPAKEGDEGQPEAAPAGTPEMHVVEKGDTLWDICQKYFTDPWRWPQMWAENPLITNPHWIFPGDVLRLQNTPEVAPPGPGAPTTPTTPGIQRSGDQYSGNGTGMREFGFVDPRELAAGGEINGSREEKIMLSTGDSAYVAFPASQPLRAGERYTIYRPEPEHPVVDPVNGQLLGYVVYVIGDVQIDQVTDGQMARGTLLDLAEPAERGYKVGPVFRAFKNVEPRASAVTLESMIVSTIFPNSGVGRPGAQTMLIGHQMLVVMNRGRSAGVELGNRFFIIRRGDGYKPVLESWEARDPRFPKEVVGELMAIDVRDNLTIAYVLRGSKELRIGDIGEMRRGY